MKNLEPVPICLEVPAVVKNDLDLRYVLSHNRRPRPLAMKPAHRKLARHVVP